MTIPLAPASPLEGPVPVVGAGYQFVPAVALAPDGLAVEWRAVVFGHTVTTADSLEAALAGIANDLESVDGNPDTFDVDLPRDQTPLEARHAHAFTKPGTYYYFCRYHVAAGMVGEIVVEQTP